MLPVYMMLGLLGWSLTLHAMQQKDSAAVEQVPLLARQISFVGGQQGILPVRQSRRASVVMDGVNTLVPPKGSESVDVFTMGVYRSLIPKRDTPIEELQAQLQTLPSSCVYEVNLASYIRSRVFNLNTQQVISLVFHGNDELEGLNITSTNLKGIDVSACSNLTLVRSVGDITRINLMGCTKLVELIVEGGKLQTIDVRGCDVLMEDVLRRVFRLNCQLQSVALNKQATIKTIAALLLHTQYLTELDAAECLIDAQDLICLVRDYIAKREQGIYQHGIHLKTSNGDYVIEQPQAKEAAQ